MNKSALVLTMKPYLVAAVTTICLASFAAGASGYENERHTEYAAQESSHKKGHYGNHQRRMKQRFKMMAMQLELTKEQRGQVREILSSAKVEKKERREEMLGFKEQLKSLVLESEFNEDKFKAIYAEYQPELEGIAMNKAKVRHAIYQVLTAEQKEKFNNMRPFRGQSL